MRMFMTTLSNGTANGTDSSDFSDGNCAASGSGFVLYATFSAVAIAFVLALAFLMRRRPSGNAFDWGRPYAIGLLLFNIALWNVVPPAADFVFFHVFTTDLFPYQTNASCIQLQGIPFIPIILFLQGLMIMTLYSVNSVRSKIADYVTPMQQDKEEKVLILGITARGLLLVDAVEKQRSGQTKSNTIGVDYSHQWKPYVEHNLRVAGVESSELSKHYVESIHQAGNKFILPFDNDSFDRVVIPPFLRNALPIGDFVTSEQVKQVRMQRLISEAMRVLKSGGTLLCVDQAPSAVMLWADLRDARVNAVIEDNGVVMGAVPTMQSPVLFVHATKELASISPTAAGALNGEGSPQSPLLFHDAMATSATLLPPLPHATQLRIILAYQVVFFIILTVITYALYDPLSFPTNIPLSQRVNNIAIGIAASYPMMAYFSRQVLLQTDEHVPSAAVLLRMLVKSESISLVVSCAFNILLSIPTLILQIVLADTSSLSSDARSYIGLAISIAIGIFSFKNGRKAMQTAGVKKRNIPEVYAHYILSP